MKLRDRIKGLRRICASELLPHPANWRTHPESQASALSAAFAEIGFAGAILCRELSGGKMQIIDGHLRAKQAGSQKVPVLVLDVTEREARKLLATLDPIGAMAGFSAEPLKQLLLDAQLESPALQALHASLAESKPIDFGDPPPSVEKNLRELVDVAATRRRENEAIATKHDTENYLAIVFASREAKEALLKSLGLPSDERYLCAEAVEVRLRAPPVPASSKSGRKVKAAAQKNAGACG